MSGFPTITSSLTSLGELLDITAGKADNALGSVAGFVKTVEEHKSKIDEVGEKIGFLEALYEKNRKNINKILEQISQGLENAKNEWTEDIQGQLELVKAALLSVEDLRKQWGGVSIEIAGEMVTIDQLLSDLKIDSASIEREIQTLALAIRRGAKDAQDAIDFLLSQGSAVSKVIAEWVAAFKNNQKSLEEFIAFLEIIKKSTPEGDLIPLLDSLEQAARSGGLV